VSGQVDTYEAVKGILIEHQIKHMYQDGRIQCKCGRVLDDTKMYLGHQMIQIKKKINPIGEP
jgi:hypothetical protein